MISNNFVTEAVPLTNKSPTSRLNKRSSRLSFNEQGGNPSVNLNSSSKNKIKHSQSTS